MKPLTRRTFLAEFAAATAATAATAAAPAGAITATRGAGRGNGAVPPAPAWHPTACRLCGVGCGLLVGVENNRAVAIRGDPDSPVSHGLACAKGYHAMQALYAGDRITRAQIRRDGRLVPASIGDALDLVAQRLREAVDRGGPDAAALYGSSQWSITDAYIASKLFKGVIGTNNVDSTTRLSSAAVMAGLEGTFGLDGAVGTFDDIDHADVFVIWNANLAETDPVIFSRMLDRRRANPAVRIVELATRTTRTSYATDRSILHAPHGELALANAICSELVARDAVRHDFLARHVAFKRAATPSPSTPDRDVALQAEVPTDASWSDYVEFLRAYAPERAPALAGVAPDAVRWVATLYADPARRVVSI